jgi:2-oxo-4-hydroxy-4-carboxy--5-ureidoimidazoline (OHCU) decarboxylase
VTAPDLAAGVDLPTLNELPSGSFADAIGPLFERAPRFLARLADARPYRSWDELFERAESVALSMPEADQLALIDSHPRLGADPATVRARSELSWREQGHDRPPTEHPARVDRELARLNEAYERRFGFRLVVFVAGRSRAELLPVLSAALEAERDAEIRRALRDVVAIARDRRRMLGWP